MAGPAKYVLSGCTRGCSLNADSLPAGLGELVHKWFEEGANNPTIMERASAMGTKLSNGAIGRHRAGHLHAAEVGGLSDPGKKLSELEIIDLLIQHGARQVNLSSFKVTSEQLLRAIELKHKLTEGSVFDAMFDAMSGFEDDDLTDLEGESAIRSQEEQAQEGLGDEPRTGR